MDVRVLRGRAGTIEADRELTRGLVEDAADGRAGVRVWRPHRQVAFGPRDARAEGYERARELAREREFEPVERRVGGRAVAYTGNTVAFARAGPAAEARGGIDERYAAARVDVRDALRGLGVEVDPGEPPDSFCPGTHSLQADGAKIAGLAQRITGGAALVAGLVIVRNHGEIADVLEPVYGALGLSLDPDTVGSVARAGGPADPVGVVRTIEDELLGDRIGAVEWVGE